LVTLLTILSVGRKEKSQEIDQNRVSGENLCLPFFSFVDRPPLQKQNTQKVGPYYRGSRITDNRFKQGDLDPILPNMIYTYL
jgi:hypothetical protein